MRLKCVDDIVRRFRPSYYDTIGGWVGGQCEECGQEFGIYSINILKPLFKSHVCSMKLETGSHRRYIHPKVIGLCGTHCTGKTTIVEYLKQKTKAYICPEGMDTVIKNLGYKKVIDVPTNKISSMQKNMMLNHKKSIIKSKLQRNYSLVICDRTIIDIFAYMIYYKKYMNKAVLHKCYKLVDKYLSFNMYYKIVVFPMYNIKTQDNDFRKNAGRSEIQDIILSIFNTFNYTTLVAPENKQSRLNFFDTLVKGI